MYINKNDVVLCDNYDAILYHFSNFNSSCTSPKYMQPDFVTSIYHRQQDLTQSKFFIYLTRVIIPSLECIHEKILLIYNMLLENMNVML